MRPAAGWGAVDRGLDGAAAAEIRDRVGPVMLAYNARHWDWCHLRLADLLDAAIDPMIPEHLRRALGGETPGFSNWAMAIADRPLGPGG